MLKRTGARQVEIRYSDDDQPVVWFAVALYSTDKRGRPRDGGPLNRWETAAGHHAQEAVLRLCQQILDGAVCHHCQRPSMFYEDIDTTTGPLDHTVCIYSWDPELATFRRSCE
jgi:hypothetical protein